MPGLRAQLKADVSGMFAGVGESAVFTPATSPVVTVACNVCLDTAIQGQPGGFTAQPWQEGSAITAILADFVAEPNIGETFVIDSATYTVSEVLENDGIIVKMAVIKS